MNTKLRKVSSEQTLFLVGEYQAVPMQLRKPYCDQTLG